MYHTCTNFLKERTSTSKLWALSNATRPPKKSPFITTSILYLFFVSFLCFFVLMANKAACPCMFLTKSMVFFGSAFNALLLLPVFQGNTSVTNTDVIWTSVASGSDVVWSWTWRSRSRSPNASLYSVVDTHVCWIESLVLCMASVAFVVGRRIEGVPWSANE